MHQAADFHSNGNIGCGNMTSYQFFKVEDAAAQYNFRFRICWWHCLQKIKIYQQTKFRRHISIHGCDLATSVFKNKRPPYRNSTSGFDIDHFAVICMLFCIRLPNFIKIGTSTAEIWRHIDFSRWRPRRLNTTSGFLFVGATPSEDQNLSANQISSTYLNTRLRYNYFRFWKKTSAILEFYFRFRSRPIRRNLHVWGRTRSSKMARFDRTCMTFYWSAIGNYSSILYHSRVIWRWIISWPWNLAKRSLKIIETGAIRKLGCGFLFAFYSNYGRICSRFIIIIIIIIWRFVIAPITVKNIGAWQCTCGRKGYSKLRENRIV